MTDTPPCTCSNKNRDQGEHNLNCESIRKPRYNPFVADCPVCKDRGETANVLREGDSVFLHRGNHTVVHKNLSSMTHMVLDCGQDIETTSEGVSIRVPVEVKLSVPHYTARIVAKGE